MKIKATKFPVISLLFILLLLHSCSKENTQEKAEPITPELAKISVISLPEKTMYTLGESLSLKGLIVEGIKNDNSKEKLDITEANISGFSSEKSSDNLVLTITVDKLTTTFAIKVLPIKVEKGVLIQIEPDVTTLVLPDDVKSIASKVFQWSKITNITLNEGLTSIGELAFAWSQITEINFPKTLTTIDEAAFYGCENLKSIDLSQTALTTLAHECFFDAQNLRELKLPNGLKEIGYQAFLNSNSLMQVTLPEGLLKIEEEAFRESGLVTLKLPNSLCAMDDRAFYLCGNLEHVETYGSHSPNNREIDNCRMKNSTFERCYKLKTFAIPLGVKIVGQNTLDKSPDLITMTIPATVEQIKFNAFANSSLQTVIVESKTPAIANTILGVWQAFPDNIQSIKVPNGSIEAYKTALGWNSYTNKITEH